MDRSEKVILTNMCMVYDENGYVLVQDRVDKEYTGITFPG
ncbi:8-oxo-dGTP diphosphatase [Hathewaya proteolytica DSM 3090]|uniref:8-oxo-dGTP diphosphatase n=1 Tax=Hathewaya proteolytica DSM 3090 TaxID=1121331 RepID=A0A1M6M0V4_9CLOT|nr:8-oxo-dGTP diphosphatase [Hathewaya proteolytica DSM 3090]